MRSATVAVIVAVCLILDSIFIIIDLLTLMCSSSGVPLLPRQRDVTSPPLRQRLAATAVVAAIFRSRLSGLANPRWKYFGRVQRGEKTKRAEERSVSTTA